MRRLLRRLGVAQKNGSWCHSHRCLVCKSASAAVMQTGVQVADRSWLL
jgi:hypothetical protein